MRKILIIGGSVVAVLILVVIGVIIYAVSNFDSVIKTTVENVGSEATQTKVTLNEAEISLKTAKAALRGLNVGNPEGFKTPYAFVLGEVSVTINSASITANPIVITEVVIAGPEVTYELGDRGANVDVIKKNVQAFTDKYAGAKSPDQAPKTDGEETKLIIENLYIRDGRVNVSAGFLQGRSLGAALPSIHLKDIGKDKGGASPGEVAEQLINSMTQGATKAVSGLNLDGLRKGAEDVLKGVGGGAGDAVKGVTEGAGGAIKNLLGK